MDIVPRNSRRRFWARVMSMLLLNHNFRHFTLQEILLGRSEFEEEKEIRIIFTIHIEGKIIEQADVYYRNINGVSHIEILEVPCNSEKTDGKEAAKSLEEDLVPLKGETDRIFKIFVLDVRPARV